MLVELDLPNEPVLLGSLAELDLEIVGLDLLLRELDLLLAVMVLIPSERYAGSDSNENEAITTSKMIVSK